MTNAMKVTGQWCVKMSFLLLLLVSAATSDLSAACIVPTEPEVGCPTPSVTRTGRGSGSISYSWGSSGTSYQVYYVRLADGYTSSVMTTSSTSMTIPGLAPGYYRFYFATNCEGETSDYVITDDLIIG